ncbi:MAG TPA: cell division protein FtsQ [Flavobacterium sp.]|nr:cell division protein FtsQ [Flavobacterium sp.]
MKKINWINIRLLLIMALMIFMYSFSGIKNKNREVQKIKIVFNANDYPFLNEKIVNNLLIQNFESTSKLTKDKLDLNTLENLLNTNKYVDNSEVFCSIDGQLTATIKQKKPVIRVINEAGSYYLDSKGAKIPLSENFTPRVPIFYGKIEANEQEPLTRLFDYIEKDEVLKHSIIDLKKTQKKNIIFSVRDYDYKVIFGNESNIEKKFKNYEAFLQFAAKSEKIKSYKTINLIFTDQVVCTK